MKIHFYSETKNKYGDFVLCETSSKEGFMSTTQRDKITCKRCIDKLVKVDFLQSTSKLATNK
jgi:hypothetical protein